MAQRPPNNLMKVQTYVFDLAERPFRTLRLGDDSPVSLQLRVPGPLHPPVHAPPSPPPPPPRGEGVGRTEGDPHLRLLDHVKVLARDSDDSAATAEERIKQSQCDFKGPLMKENILQN